MKAVQKVNVAALGVEVVQPSAVAVPDWWDPNQVGLSVVAAYRAINTPGNPWTNDAPNAYLDTLVNNANPGVNDLIEGNGPVVWGALAGWSFIQAAAQWFDTGLAPANGWSMFVQCANDAIVGNGFLVGSATGGGIANRLMLSSRFDVTGGCFYGSGGFIPQGPNLIAGNLATTNQRAYRNGILEGPPIGAWGPINPWSIYIGATNTAGAPALFTTSDILAVAIYDGGAAAVQAEVAAVAAAMAAL